MNFIESVNTVLSRYHSQHSVENIPIQIDHLKPIFVAEGFADSIYIEEVEFDQQRHLGRIQFMEQYSGVYGGLEMIALVQYPKSLNVCWRRMVICKEMYHVILDKEEGRRVGNMSDFFKLLDGLSTDLIQAITSTEPISTEKIAEICAIETLLPLELRMKHMERFGAGLISAKDIALAYRVPEYHVQIAMNESYIRLVDGLRAKVL